MFQDVALRPRRGPKGGGLKHSFRPDTNISGSNGNGADYLYGGIENLIGRFGGVPNLRHTVDAGGVVPGQSCTSKRKEKVMSANLFIVWSEVHATDIPIIDEQHRGIVGIINSLFYFMRKRQVSEVMIPTISILAKYAQIHFLTEVQLLEIAEYSDIVEHKKAHEFFQTKIRTISAQSRNELYSDDLLPFLKKWWIEHINGADRAYAPHVRSFLQSRHEL